MSELVRRLLLPGPMWAPEDGDGSAEPEKIDEGADEITDADATVTVDTEENAEAEGDATADADQDATTDEGDGDQNADDGGEAKPSVALTDEMRDTIAGGDKELRKLLGRYTSYKTLAQALRNAQAKIAKGGEKRAMPDPKDEKAMAEWRKAEGIPDDPSGYELPDAVKSRLTDDDKPLISSFTEYAHQRGATPAAVNLATEWYFDTLEAMQGERTAADNEARSRTEEELRADWGTEYKANLRMAASLVEGIPGVGKDWSEARMPDGRRLGDIPDFIMWAAEQGRATFGDAAFVSEESATRHGNRKKEIETIMQTDINRYWSEGLDKEYNEIVAREQKRRA